ncbi:MAG: proline--tRNA ligase [Candidatus Aenigmatarchaeota archaeon]
MAEKDAKQDQENDVGLKYKKTQLSEWYNDVVLKSDIVDFSQVKGFMFIKPNGYEIWEKIQRVFDKKIKAAGHSNAYAPALIPERFLNKEKEHVEGFAPEGFFVTETGSGKLPERLVLRPTSETIIHASYAKWIRSWRDLPVLWNYWNSVFRAEIKMTKLFLRTSEFLWQEGHTAHATHEDSFKEVMLIAKFYKELMEEELAIPVLVGKKSDKERFAGADKTITLEALMPDGKALQMGTSHDLGQNFSKAFGISYLDREQKRKYAWLTSWGISTRLIGAIVMVHGDDRGLVLPPKMAPTEVVIVPIVFDKTKDPVLKKCRELANKLRDGFSVKLDDREGYTAGWKFNEWELKGIPIRIEVGPRDVEKGHAVIVRRDTGEKTITRDADMHKTVKRTLEKMQKDMFERASKFLVENTAKATDYAALKKAVKEKKIVIAGWCGSRSCEDKIQDETTATIRLIADKNSEKCCVYCGKKSAETVYISRSY